MKIQTFALSLLTTAITSVALATPVAQTSTDGIDLPTAKPKTHKWMKLQKAKRHGKVMVRFLKPNQELVHVNLKANDTTGYQWYVSRYNHDLLQLIGYQYQAPTDGKIGGGGEAQFTFRAKADFLLNPQVTRIQLVYMQPWAPKKTGKRNSMTVRLFSPAQSNTSPSALPVKPMVTAPVSTPAASTAQQPEAFPVPHHAHYPTPQATANDTQLSTQTATHSTTVNTHMMHTNAAATTAPAATIPTDTQPSATTSQPQKTTHNWLSLPATKS